jgi:ELWxxDGT repeat protein
VLVKDVNPGAASSDLFDLTNVDGTLFFSAVDVAHGFELWRSDGTIRGTTLVKDINPGPSSSEPRGLTNVNGTLFFVADDGIHGLELWKSDGTAAGTTLVKDILAGPDSSQPLFLTDVDGTAFFNARDETDGRELWKSDGTAAGTALVKNNNPGAASSFPLDHEYLDNPLTDVNGTLFFDADDAIHGLELWKSDGTARGTTLVGDIKPGARRSLPGAWSRELVNVDGTLFFAADDGTHGFELWKTKPRIREAKRKPHR